MKLLVEIPEEIMTMNKRFGYIDIRLHKDGNLINKVTTATDITPYFAFINFQPLPDDCEILTKEAYADLCMRASKCEEV